MATFEDETAMPCTVFEKYLTEFLQVCTSITRISRREVRGNKELNAQVKSYNAAYQSTLKKNQLHVLHAPAFRDFAPKLPATSEAIVDLEWLVTGKAMLRYVRPNGEYAEKVAIDLSGVYSLVDDDDVLSAKFLYLFLRCVETSSPIASNTTGPVPIVEIGKAAHVYQADYEEMDADQGEDDTTGGFMNAIGQLKKVITNPEILRAGTKELSDAYKSFKDNPQAAATLSALTDEQGTLEDKLGTITKVVENYKASKDTSEKD